MFASQIDADSGHVSIALAFFLTNGDKNHEKPSEVIDTRKRFLYCLTASVVNQVW